LNVDFFCAAKIAKQNRKLPLKKIYRMTSVDSKNTNDEKKFILGYRKPLNMTKIHFIFEFSKLFDRIFHFFLISSIIHLKTNKKGET